MREVDIPLTREAITALMETWTSYKRTDSLVLKHGDEYAVVKLHKDPGEGLFRHTSHNEILSLPEDTIFVEDPEMDVLNTPAMARLQSEHPGKTIVVRGMFSHISFVHDLQPLKLVVTDSIPPTPCKLAVLVQRALDSGFIDLPIVPEYRIIDMSSRIPEVQTPAVMFPCRVSHMTAEKPFYFLDDAPKDLDGPVTLIGCHLSMRIFKELYGYEPPFLTVCPADYIRPGERTLVKCCKIKEGHVRTSEDVVQVPWGATVPEIVGAINDLFSDYAEPSSQRACCPGRTRGTPPSHRPPCRAGSRARTRSPDRRGPARGGASCVRWPRPISPRRRDGSCGCARWTPRPWCGSSQAWPSPV